MFPIIEKFLSIDGEGPTAGELATFVRFQGCNLRCSWCDTTYSFGVEQVTQRQTAQEIYDYIRANPARNVTLTGGEPLLQLGIEALLELLDQDPRLQVHVETNGSVNIRRFQEAFPRISFVIDFKLPGSGMTQHMDLGNLSLARPQDVYKFVVQDRQDLEYARNILEESDLCSHTQVHISPVLSKIAPVELVEFMKEYGLDRVKLQIQLHKIVWDPQERGV